jgi:TPR repeat protein
LLVSCGPAEDAQSLFDAGEFERSLALATAEADLDRPAAANLVGVHYYLGAGVERDFAEAGRWFERAALLGNPSAQRNLATLYLRGLGVKQDDFLAYAWFTEAAERGNPRAARYMAIMGDALTPSEMVRARKVLNAELDKRLPD